MRLDSLIGILALTIAATARSVPSSRLTIHESLSEVPNGWEITGKPDSTQRLSLRVALHSNDRGLLHQAISDISDPRHIRYGQHLSKSEVRQLSRPAVDITQAVLSWLEQAGIAGSDVTDDYDWIPVNAPVVALERMLNCTFMTYHHQGLRSDQGAPAEIVRTLQYSVPEHLRDQISFVGPITRFPRVQQSYNILHESSPDIHLPKRATTAIPSCDGTSVTPDCLRELYNITGYTPSTSETGTLAISGFLEQYPRYSDLDDFIAKYAPSQADANFTWTSVNGGLLDQDSSQTNEANLDVQYALTLSYPLHNGYYSVAGRVDRVPDLLDPPSDSNTNEPFFDLFSYLLNMDNPPHTVTNSYSENEQTVPTPYANKVCDMIGALGARGVSVIFASGDHGVGKACQTNDGRNLTRFQPIFPATCPYVTSVGGTHFVNPERGIVLSSGGFSDRYARPRWQDTAVSKYLDNLGDQWDGLCNRSGRGFPDVAAQSSTFKTFDKGELTSFGGTSASAPVFAAIIALLNAARIEAGGQPLGFLNPWLYGTVGPAEALNDITAGRSTGCTRRDITGGADTPYVPYASWNATVGWDPVTGLGTPDFGKTLGLVR